MRLKELEGVLQQVETFQSPKVHLEQYATSAQLASHILYTAENSYDDVCGKMVADLGCGSGVFTIGARCLEAAYSVGFDIDEDALALASQNLLDFEMDCVDLVRCDVTVDSVEVSDASDSDDGDDEEEEEASDSEDDDVTGSKGDSKETDVGDGAACAASELESARPGTTSSAANPTAIATATAGGEDGCSQWRRWKNQFDTVFLNPPFGTKANAGIDIAFLKRAIQLSRGAVYSLHKTATRKYIKQLSDKQLGVACEVVAEMKFDLPKTYKFHRKKSVDVAVDLLRFDCSRSTMLAAS